MSINLVQAVNDAVTEPIAEHLAQQFGIPGQVVRQLAARTAPGIVAMLMDRASLAPGARSLYSVVKLPETNAYIVEQLGKLISTTGGLRHLEANGHSLYALASGQRMDSLTDAVSAETGVPTQATSALAGVVAATLFGIVKRHFLLAQWGLPQLPKVLREQVTEIKAQLSNGVAAAIGAGNTEGFTNSIVARLDAVGSTLEEREDAEAHAMTAAADPAGSIIATPASMAPVAAPPTAPPARTVARRPAAASKKSNNWIWLLFAVLAAILGLVFYHGFTNGHSVQLNAPEVSAPVTGEQPASPVAASLVVTEDNAAVGASGAFGASGASAAVGASSAAATVEASGASAAVGVSSAAATVGALGASATLPDAKDAQLVFSVDAAGVPTVQATVGTEAEKRQLVDALAHRFGKGYTAQITVSPNTRPATWLSRLTDFTPLMAVPGAEVNVTGTKVDLGGAAADGKLGWTDRLKATLGGMFQVGAFDVNKAVASATDSFRSAMKTLLNTDEACSGDKLTKVLDLQVVNFARSSATVPENAYATLGETAQLLKNCAAKGSMVHLEVAGYSDSTGTAPTNLEMSKERALAVRGFLVRAGVPSQTLTAAGYGDANPVADNATQSGRFANRRIEFVVK